MHHSMACSHCMMHDAHRVTAAPCGLLQRTRLALDWHSDQNCCRFPAESQRARVRTATASNEHMATLQTCRYLRNSPLGLIHTLQAERRLAQPRVRSIKISASASTRQLTNVESASATNVPAAPHIPVLLHEILHAFSKVDLKVSSLTSLTRLLAVLTLQICSLTGWFGALLTLVGRHH